MRRDTATYRSHRGCHDLETKCSQAFDDRGIDLVCIVVICPGGGPAARSRYPDGHPQRGWRDCAADGTIDESRDGPGAFPAYRAGVATKPADHRGDAVYRRATAGWA